MLILKEKDILELCDWKEIIDVVYDVFERQSNNQTITPHRILINLEAQGADKITGGTYFKPSFVEGVGLGCKVVSVYPDNAKKNLPVVPASIYLADTHTGMPKALLAGTYITGFRTAAGSAVSARIMAKKDAKIMVVFGSGLQAESHILALMTEFPNLEEVIIGCRRMESGNNLLERLKTTYHVSTEKIRLVEGKGDELAAKADIIVTATSSSTPLFNGKVVKPGTHIICVGTASPKDREVDNDAVVNSRVIVDELSSCIVSGDLAAPLEQGVIKESHILGPLGDVLTGKIKARTSPSDITLYKSAGTAIMDIATAHWFTTKATQLNKGLLINDFN
ncbi:hypothetical protein DFA_03041 [Cavenderia fasciculata]|uniref:Ornithine cyclodeaminase n=1 Tax=Cavenderia fasciculata TaxID=261658 RepID=F4PGG3_CACFS|nr:uncharacterized protein DFA_03041 [Cavenderia fasciculata]EGG24797.1 hypothetical protein DFA_03041 [Cavenderia fasciculata]|eukprot:XP_004362648.1 hypothetical protein DFA_03041 [Cavenderia fasciculata]